MHALYRFYDNLGQLLYVGITDNPARRFSRHAGSKDWWHKVRGISIEWYDDRSEVKSAERRAIHVEHPAYNVHRAEPRHRATAKRCGHCFGCRRSEPCYLFHYDDPEDRLDECSHCGHSDCLYALGHEDGDFDGWSRMYDLAKERGFI